MCDLFFYLGLITVSTCGLIDGYQAVIVAVLTAAFAIKRKLAGGRAEVLPYPSNPGLLSGWTILWADPLSRLL